MRHKPHAITRYLAIATVLLLVAAACGTTDETTTTGATATTTTAAAAEATTTTEAPMEVRTIELGLIVPESGFLAVIGEELVNGTEVAVAQWNEAHDDVKANLTICDNEADVERTLSCIRSLEGSVDLFLGPHFANPAVGIQPVLTEEGYFLVSSNIITIPDVSTNFFLSNTTVVQILDGMFEYFGEEGLESVGLIAVEDATGDAAVAGFLQRGETSGIEVVAAQFLPDAQSAVPQLNQILAEDVELIVIWTVGPTGVTALRAIDDVGTDLPLLMLTTNATPSTFVLAGDAIPEDPDQLMFFASDSLAPHTIEDPVRRERMETFISLYEAANGSFPPWVAFTGADAVAVSMAAAAGADEVTADAMAAFLESGGQIDGYHIPSFLYSADSHVNTNPNVLQPIVWRDGSWDLPG